MVFIKILEVLCFVDKPQKNKTPLEGKDVLKLTKIPAPLASDKSRITHAHMSLCVT